MARVALTAAGGLAGFALAGPAGVKWGLMAGGFVGGLVEQALTRPDPAKMTGPNIEQLRIQNSAYGKPIPKVWGTVRLAGNVIYGGHYWEAVSGSQQYLKAYVGIGVCEGPVDKLLRIWADGEVIYDSRGDNYRTLDPGWFESTFHLGDETQTHDYVLGSVDNAVVSGDLIPGHRGLVWWHADGIALDKYNYRLPNFEFEISTNASTTVSHTVLEDVIAATTDKDNIVFYPDDIYYCIASNDTWYKINTLTNTVVVTVTHSDPEIPLNDGGFDIDENNVIHTVKEGGSGFAVFCQLDGDTFSEITADTETFNYARVVRVCRNSSYPYVAAIQLNGGVGDTLRITHRSNYTFGGGTDYVTISPPTNEEWTGLDFDDVNGTLWAVSAGYGAYTTTTISKIDVNSNGSYTITQWSATQINRGKFITYDADDDLLVLASDYAKRIATYEASDPSNYIDYDDFTLDDFFFKSTFRRGVVNGYLYFEGVNTATGLHTVHQYDVVNNDTENNWTADESGLCGCGSADTGGAVYCVTTHAMIYACVSTSNSDYIKLYLDRGTGSPVTLASIVEDICVDAGLDASSEIDVSDLETTLVTGYAINNRMSAREALQPLMDAYFFDVVDSDGMLKFVMRGGSSAVTISDDDLGAYEPGNEPAQKLIITRQQEVDLPVAVDVVYIDANAGNVTGVQQERRLITQSNQTLTLRLPIIMTADDAKQIAVKHMANMWTQRTKYAFSTFRKYAYLDATDVITISEDSNTHTVRLDSIEYAGPILNIQGTAENAAVYDSDATGGTLPEPDDNDVTQPGPTLLVLLDVPLISSSNNATGIYVCTLGYTEYWTGCNIFKNDSGVWDPLDRPWMNSTYDATIGKAATVLAAPDDTWLWDEANTVSIRLLDETDTLTNATEAEVLNGGNIAVLGDEIIQFRTATLESDGSYTLSGLLRGRYGSEWANGTHAVGEYFVLIDGNVQFADMPESEEDETRWYRATSYGTLITTGATQYLTAEFRNMMPWSPQHVSATRNETGDINITWIRRTRIGGELTDGGDVPLGETVESYEIDVYDGSDVIRTLTSSTNSVTYTAAQQSASTDFGSVQSSVDVIVYQISSVVGRGFGTEATV